MAEAWQIIVLSLTLCSVKASLLSCVTTSQHPTTQLYALKISSTVYSTVESTSISVKVYMSVCPGSDTRGPSWYKLEPFSEESQKLEGTFAVPPLRSEAILTNNSAAIEFSTTEPIAISDLPRVYEWTKQGGHVGEICFRLTVLANDSESDGCRQTQMCIAPLIIPTDSGSTSGNSVEDKTDSEEEQTNSHSHEEEPEDKEDSSSGAGVKLVENHVNQNSNRKRREVDCYKKRNCTHARLRDFCANDGNTYPSRCAIRLQECLLNKNLEIVDKGKCASTSSTREPSTSVPNPSTSAPEPTPCWEEQNFYIMINSLWYPKCTDKGGYKPIQCNTNSVSGKLQCWCSNNFGSFLGEKENYECEDPESFDQFNHCVAQLEDR